MSRKSKSRRMNVTHDSIAKKAEKVLKYRAVLYLGNGKYLVASKSRDDTYYDVTVLEGKWRCTCAYHVNNRERHCKHITAVQMLITGNKTWERDEKPVKVMAISDPEATCPHCKGSNCVYIETRYNKHGESERYRCEDCDIKFTHRHGFKGCQYPDRAIALGLYCMMANMSQEDAAKIGEEFCGRKPSGSTINRWMEKFGSVLKCLAYAVASGRVGKHWAVDEVFIRILGGEAYVFGVIDQNSRFLIVHGTSCTKQGYDAVPLFKDAIRIAGKKPWSITTDALSSFVNGVEEVFLMGDDSTIYIKDAAVNKVHANNNKYERFNGTIKQRTTLARRFNSPHPALPDMYIAYYNLLRPHLGLDGATPAEKLGLVIKTAQEKCLKNLWLPSGMQPCSARDIYLENVLSYAQRTLYRILLNRRDLLSILVLSSA